MKRIKRWGAVWGISTAVAVTLMSIQPIVAAYASTLIVTNTNDSGTGSLRAAIDSANATSAKDTIKFTIPGSGPHTIVLASALPPVTRPVIIDGTTQPTFAGTLGVRLRCVSFGCLTLASGSTGSTVKGLAIGGAVLGSAIAIEDSNNHIIQGNYLGTLDGVTNQNNDFGVRVEDSTGVLIGGTATGQGNVIAANDESGILLTGSGVSDVTIQGNRIGTTVAGGTALGNGFGVHIDGAADTLVGGATSGAGNVISGNTNVGLRLVNGATGTLVQGNLIGLDATGTLSLANGIDGVAVIDSSGNTIGGDDPDARNVISGNTRHGVVITGATASGNVVQGNAIGTDITGTLARSNADTGVRVINAPDNVIGGLTADERNVISGNTTGVSITGATASGNIVQGNFIGTDETGTSPLGNAVNGVVISGAPTTTVGGVGPGAGNVISANNANGIYIDTAASAGTVVRGNAIGTDAGGTLDLGNGNAIGYGITLVNTSSVTVGGVQPGEGNRIANNLQGGIDSSGNTTLTIAGNRIENNTGTGINLGSGGIAANTMNCIQGNTIGMENVPVTSTTAQNNWWGSTTGPTHTSNPGGTGQLVQGNAVVVPFVTSSCEEMLGQHISNGGMESATALLPDGWVGSKLVLGATGDGQDNTTFNSGANSFRFDGDNKTKSLAQTINVGGGVGEDITLTLYTRQDSLPAGGTWKVTLTVYHTDGSKQTATLNLPTVTTASFALSSIPALTTTETYTKIDVKIEIKKNGGTAWIDDVSVIAVP